MCYLLFYISHYNQRDEKQNNPSPPIHFWYFSGSTRDLKVTELDEMTPGSNFRVTAQLIRGSTMYLCCASSVQSLAALFLMCPLQLLPLTYIIILNPDKLWTQLAKPYFTVTTVGILCALGTHHAAGTPKTYLSTSFNQDNQCYFWLLVLWLRLPLGQSCRCTQCSTNLMLYT